MPIFVPFLTFSAAMILASAAAGGASGATTPDAPRDDRLNSAFDLDHPAAFQPAFTDRTAWERRVTELREQVLVALGLWPMPEKTPLDPVIHGRIDRDGYTVEKVFFRSMPGHYVSGSLYRPKGRTGKLPGVLCPHGHWQNGRFYENTIEGAEREIASGAEKTTDGARYPLQARCAMLARMGCVVFHYDMVGNADSTRIGHGEGFNDAEAELRAQSFMGLQAWNSILTLDFLASLPDVDPARIAVTGASGGGTQTFILCAIDSRPAVAFPAVMVSAAMQGGCICENCSGLRVGTNNVELAALFAPKPLGMTGADDWTREIETRGLPELKAIYRLYGAEENVAAKYYPFPHNYNQVSRERMYSWLNAHLKLGWPEPVEEKPFTPIPPHDLSVFDADHPLPSDAMDAAHLRRSMTEASDRQMAEIRKHPEEYRRVVGTALREMVHDRLPDRGKSGAIRWLDEEHGDGYAVRRGVIDCPDGRHSIPILRLEPDPRVGAPNHAPADRPVVLWVHPGGRSSLLGEDGKPVPAVQSLLDRGRAVVAAHLFFTAAFAAGHGDSRRPAVWGLLSRVSASYAGYAYGFNRPVLAERVHDLLRVIGALRDEATARRVDLIGVGEAGPWALLARALSGDAIARAAIDLNGFDFDKVHRTDDPMMLPGALKYGGVYGFAPLLTGANLLCDARKTGQYDLSEQVKGLVLRQDRLDAVELARWLVEGQ